jgi:predicted RNase H-like HicB family nuclease
MIVPGLNHLASFGETLAEAFRMVEDAVLLYLATLRDEGLPIPEDSTTFELEMGEAREAFVCKLAG